MKYKLFLLMALMIGAVGCSVKDIEVESDYNLKIVFTALPFEDGDTGIDTKTSVVPNESYSSYEFIWSAEDTVGIYPDAGSQIYFTMENGAGVSSASFDGGAWTCKDGHTFRSYYPFIGNIYLNATQIPVFFTGQKQVGNDNSDHFQKYDYMYTAATKKDDGLLNFAYSHLITAVLTWVELPAGHYTGLTLSLDEELFVTKGKYDLTAETPTIVGEEYSNTMNIDLDISFNSPDVLKVYVPLAPMDMSGKTLTITIMDDSGKEFQYTYNPSKPYLASKIYRLKSANSFVEEDDDYVDLGLSVKWAKNNLGASAPEEFGNYYAWGEVSPQSSNAYSWASYEWCAGSILSFTKYCFDYDYGNYYSYWDINYTLDPEDDVASITLGGKWRMPTELELQELRENCIWTWTDDMNGVAGYVVSSKVNSNSIFLPAAGRRYNNKSTSGEGYYWSSSNRGTDKVYYAEGLYFKSGSYTRLFGLRSDGHSVRPVYSDIEIPVQWISIVEFSHIELSVGRTTQLKVYFYPELASNQRFTWASSNEGVATVSDDGTVCAVAEGTATLTVTSEDGNKTATCEVLVIQETTANLAVDMGLSVKWASMNIGAGKPEDYGDLLTWNDATSTDLGTGWHLPSSSDWKELTDNCTWTWEARNGIRGFRVVSNINGNSVFFPACGYIFNNNGRHLYSGRACHYWLSSADPSNSSNALSRIFNSSTYTNVMDASWSKSNCFSVRAVYDIIHVTGVSLNKTELSLSVGSSATLSATVNPENASDKTVTWSSSNTSVATVSNGTVTAKGVGTAIITATTGGKSATCTVTVAVPVTGVSLNKTDLSLTKGSTETLTATITPSNATNENVTWNSSKTSVATVDSNGMVTAVSSGSATITVTTADGSFTASCQLTVTNPVTRIALYSKNLGKEVTSLSMLPDDSDELSIVFYPSDASDINEYKNLTDQYWQSSNSCVTCTFGAISADESLGNNSSIVSVYVKGLSASCSVKLLNASTDAVDLGLSVKWMNRNVYTSSSSDFGPYYEWNEAKDRFNGDWRLPTKEEAEELVNNCTFTRSGNGYIVTSKINGNTIFLPLAGGIVEGTYYSHDKGKASIYFTSTAATSSTFHEDMCYRIQFYFDEQPSVVANYKNKWSVRLVTSN